MGFTCHFLAVDQEGAVVGEERLPMPFRFKALSATLSIIAAAAITGPGRAQQYPPSAGQEPVPSTRTAATTANVNLRSGPGADSEIIVTIPAGSTVRIASCSGEWCEVTWNGRSGYAIARNLSSGAQRQARTYGPQPGYTGGYGPEPQPGYSGGYGPGPHPGYGGGYGPGPQPGYSGGYGPGPQPGYTGGYGPEPPVVYEEPGYYVPPAVVYGPAYYGPAYYGPGFYGPGWGWRRRWR